MKLTLDDFLLFFLIGAGSIMVMSLNLLLLLVVVHPELFR